MTGRLIGVGVGPGDPELMTLKAHRIISTARVVAYPAPDSGESFARRIACGSFSTNVVEIPMIVPMTSSRFPAQTVYDKAANDIAGHLSQGQDVVVLCEGDPFFYGSFMYLFSRLSDKYQTEIVPGVSSLCAVSAAARQPLCARGEQVTILPATLEADALRERLKHTQAAAIMKLGRHFDKAKSVVKDLGMDKRAWFVSHASLPNEKACPLSQAPEIAPYFSMILIPGEDIYV